MLTLQPEIVQAMVVGDKRPYLVGLIVPDCDWTAEWAVANGKRLDFAELGRAPEYLRALSGAVDRVNADQSVIDKVRRFDLADEPFPVENQHLTHPIKIRPHVRKETSRERLEQAY